MRNTRTLVQHRDIQTWVSARKGLPAMVRMRNNFGEVKARLSLKFQKSQHTPTSAPGLDDGMSPCSWNAWLAELDRQQLALRVSNQSGADFEFIGRKELDRPGSESVAKHSN